jgi:HlyD family secretion protein
MLAALLVLLVSCGTEHDPAPLVGTVERTEVEISAPVSEILVELAVTRGSRVEVGDLVARLDDTVARAERDAASARLTAAGAARKETRRELARIRGLRRSAVASPQDLDRARLAHDEAVAREAEAQARVVQANRRLAEHTLTAPVSGVVDQLPFDRGERVPPGGVVAVLCADGLPWVRVWCPARALALLSLGSRAEIRVHGIEKPLRGRVIDVAREPAFTPHFALTEREREHLVYEARVEIVDAPDGLRPGLPAEVRFSTNRTETAR